ncbi:MAG: hypothetical protein NVSMB65_16940 [Chloroflexota bacterium]
MAIKLKNKIRRMIRATEKATKSALKAGIALLPGERRVRTLRIRVPLIAYRPPTDLYLRCPHCQRERMTYEYTMSIPQGHHAEVVMSALWTECATCGRMLRYSPLLTTQWVNDATPTVLAEYSFTETPREIASPADLYAALLERRRRGGK